MTINREQFERGVDVGLNGGERYYGCHFGMRSTLEDDRNSFFAGFDIAKGYLGGKGEFKNIDLDTAIAAYFEKEKK